MQLKRRCTGYLCGLLTLAAPAAVIVARVAPARAAPGQVEAADAAITKYLAAFLTAHGETVEGQADHDPARPDMVLFNGGLFESPVLRERLLAVLSSWFNNASAMSPSSGTPGEGGGGGSASRRRSPQPPP